MVGLVEDVLPEPNVPDVVNLIAVLDVSDPFVATIDIEDDDNVIVSELFLAAVVIPSVFVKLQVV